MDEVDSFWFDEVSRCLCEGLDNQMSYEGERLLVELFRQLSPEFQGMVIEYLQQLLMIA